MTYGLFGKLTAQPGRRDELVEILTGAAAALEADPGCLHYVVATSAEPDDIWVWEAWTDKAAHDASLEPPEVREVITRAMPLIAGMSGSTEVDIVGGKGLPA
ncbi:putative quinol monooxygenase [Georgenia subflava]|uniref:Antibiotic biosynthesis monooxygenase n=1 Tax=Georgenia subflava TaxID=1622177 RepID=A0A6N7EEA4_9MICO|nr:putative quinol monooxygenase [Georgenia subflava]MPV36439.1 antibiotic biosynthesis monooxygenase [Georgenia subflava]